MNNKNKVLAGLLAIFFVYLEIHKFYLGFNRSSIIEIFLKYW